MLKGLKALVIICLGQSVSTVGSGLTSFAINVWIYQHSQTATAFALLGMFSFLPGALILPFAGVITDRYDKRVVMLLSNVSAAVAILVVAMLQGGNHLQIWFLCIVASFMSACIALQNLTLMASISLLVQPEQLPKANGIKQIGPALARVVSPTLAAIILHGHSLRPLFLSDSASYFIAGISVLPVVFPTYLAGQKGTPHFILQDICYGWKELFRKDWLIYLALLAAVAECASQVGYLLLAPLVLKISTPKMFGLMMSSVAGGVLAGSIVVSLLGVPKFRIATIIGVNLIEAVAFMMAGTTPNLVLITCVFATFAFCAPFSRSATDTLLQALVPADVQGRVFGALRQLIAMSVPIAFICAGPMVDHVLTPLASNRTNAGAPCASPCSSHLTGITGMFIFVGAGVAAVTLWVYFGGKLNHLAEVETVPAKADGVIV